MRREDRTEYIVGALREAGAMYEEDARAFLGEHDAEVLRGAADAINALPQDYECDPGRGDAAELLRRMADEAGKVTRDAGEITQPADFFQPGRTYTDNNGYRAPELTTLFRVEHVTRHPERGHLRAIGWSRNGAPGSSWHGDFRDEGEFEGWTAIGGGDAGQAEPAQPAELTIYRASHDSIVMGLYTTRDAAREHCEAEERREWMQGTNLTFAWTPDDSDPLSVEELSVFAGQNEESATGYVVTPLPVASAYDEEADE